MNPKQEELIRIAEKKRSEKECELEKVRQERAKLDKIAAQFEKEISDWSEVIATFGRGGDVQQAQNCDKLDLGKRESFFKSGLPNKNEGDLNSGESDADENSPTSFLHPKYKGQRQTDIISSILEEHQKPMTIAEIARIAYEVDNQADFTRVRNSLGVQARAGAEQGLWQKCKRGQFVANSVMLDLSQQGDEDESEDETILRFAENRIPLPSNGQQSFDANTSRLLKRRQSNT